MKRLVIVVAVLAFALTAALAYRLHAQREALEGPSGGSGVIEGTTVDLGSRLAARVSRIAVAKGDRVEADQLLVELDCEEPRARLAEVEARLAVARSQADAASAQMHAARSQSSAARAAAAAAGAQLEALSSQRDVAQREAGRVESLGRYAAASQTDRAQAAAQGLDHQVAAARSQRNATALQARGARSQADAAAAGADAARLSLAVLEANLRLAQIAVSECEVHAPRAGIVEDVYFEVGELTTPGATLLRIVDLDEVKVVFYLPNAELSAVTEGQRAEVVADAWPDRVFEGRVATVSTEAEFTPRNIQTRTDRDRLVYPVEVRVPNPQAKLRPGMPVQVSIPDANPETSR